MRRFSLFSVYYNNKHNCQKIGIPDKRDRFYRYSITHLHFKTNDIIATYQ